VLEQNPLLAGTTVNHLLDIAAIAREITLERDTTLFDETDGPAVYYVLSGTIRLERADLRALEARPGATIGMPAGLAGMPVGWRGIVEEDGYALCMEREDLIDLLAEEVELLRHVASAILHTAPLTRMPESGSLRVA
jgi:CRP-like cAMP-binding protein